MKPVTICGLALLVLAGCAEGKLVFGGKSIGAEADNVIVSGRIDDTMPANPARDIVVFVYTNLRCCDPAKQPDADLAFSAIDFSVPPFDGYELEDFRSEDVEAVIVEAGSDSFELDDISNGELTLIFLLDDPEPDGEVNPGDLTAVLEDEDEELDDVLAGRSVDVDDIDVDFDTDFPEGVATPDSITVSVTQQGS